MNNFSVDIICWFADLFGFCFIALNVCFKSNFFTFENVSILNEILLLFLCVLTCHI
jgi:hypothetical protein